MVAYRSDFKTNLTLVHFTVAGGNEAEVDLVLIILILMVTSIFKHNFHTKRKEVCIKQGQLSFTFTQKLGY